MADEALDQLFLIKGSEDLAEYLSSTTLFWRLQSESQPLTIGNLLLAQKKVAAYFPDPMPANLNAAVRMVEMARAERPAAWQKKADEEFHARLNQYRTLVEELDKGGYGVIARLRTILQLLLSEVSDSGSAALSLKGLDGRLRFWLAPGKFMWTEVLQSAFPEDEFWFLYGKPLNQAVR